MKPSWFALLMLLLSAYSQAEHGVESVRFRSLGTESGLPQASVASLLQDRQGFMWFATQDGLSRYDGYRFKNFRRSAEQTDSLADNYLLALAEDELGQLWIASQSPQLTLFEPSLERFSRLPLKKDGKSVAADDYVVSMLALPGPRLLLSMRRSGMLLLDARTRAFLPLSLPAAARARGLARLADGRLAYALDHRVYLGDSALAEPRLLVELPVGTVPNDLESDPSGGFWLASADSGLYRLGADGAVLQNFRTGSASDSLSDNFCRDLLRDSLGRLWISTSNGLSRLKPDARTFEVWRTRAGDPGSLPGNRISELFEDRSGMLWIGTWTGGPATHDLRAEWLSLIHRVEQDPSSLPSNQVGSVLVDADSHVWAALVDRQGIAKFSPSEGLIAHWREANSPLPADDASVLAPADNGEVWAGTLRAGLLRINQQGRLLEQLQIGEGGLSGNSIVAVHQRSDGALWVGTLSAGLNFRCAGCKSFEHFRMDPNDSTSLPGDTVSSILERKNGEMWFGLRRAGLVRWLPESRTFQRFYHNPERADSLSHASVTAVLEDHQQRLWVGTQSGGINLMPDPSVDHFEVYARAQGMPSDAVVCLHLDASGAVWGALTGALVRIDAKTRALRVFDAGDGLQGRDFFAGSCELAADGRLYFGGLHGITVVDPSRVPAPLALPGVQLTEFHLSNGELSPGLPELPQAIGGLASIALAHSERLFALGFSAMDFRAPTAMRFRYRLQGFQEQWTEVSAQRRFVPYTNLPAGEYQFEVQAAQGSGDFGPTTGLSIVIARAPWATPLAYALYVLTGAVLLGTLLWRIRLRWQEREHARTRIETSEKRLKVVLSTSGCELWVVDLINKRMYRESALSQLGPDFDAEGTTEAVLLSRLHPGDRQRFLQTLEAYVQGESARFEMVYRVRAQDKSYIWLRSVGHVQERTADGQMRIISGTTFEVSELKESEVKLQLLNEELGQRVAELEAARGAIVEVDKRRKLALWGSGCEFFEAMLDDNKLLRENRMVDLAANDSGDALSDYWPSLHPDDLAGFSDVFVRHVKGETEFFDMTYRARRRDMSWAWIQTRGRAVAWNQQGRASVIAGTNYEVSELKESERKLQHLADDLEQRVEARTRDLSQTLEQLKRTQRQLVDSEKMAALGGLVAGVAHEINTPLGIGVTAASHLGEQSEKLRRKLDSGALKKSDIEDFVSSACQATELVMANLRRASELIKSFKQVAVDQSSEQRRLIELKPYIHDILNSMRPTLKRVSHQVQVECSEGVLWDTFPGALYQILMNLIMNSLNHAFEGVERGQMRIVVRIEAQAVELEYSDNGVGMDEEVRKRAFEPFFTTKRGQGGSGLGLHIVFNLVTQVLAGAIDIISAPGQGARFVIRVSAGNSAISGPRLEAADGSD